MDRESEADAASEFIRVETEADVYDTLVRSASHLLPADLCKVAIVEGDKLVPRARSDDRPVDPTRRLAIEGTSVGHAVTTGRPILIDDIRFKRSAAASSGVDQELGPDEPRAVLAVPLGNDGVLVGTAPQPGVFTADHRETAERLAAFAEAALDRITGHAHGLPDNDRFSELGSMVAHDLRSPLGVARGYTRLVQETGDLGHLESVVQALDRMDEMITDLRDLVESGHRIDAQEAVSLSDLAAECWGTVATGRATLSIDGETEVRADQNQLRHLLENLFRNAVEHGGEDVTVIVGLLADGFYVEDSGPGIPSELGDSVFEAGVTTSESGTGYGLAIVEQIVEAHGWEISVTESDEGGARFEITGVQ